MAFGYVLIKHATYGGLYYTSNFTATGTQPTWTRITTTGLPATDDLTWLAVDPFNPRDRQTVLYAPLSGANALYARNGGNWSLILDEAAASAVVGKAVDANDNLTAPWYDPLVEGKLIAFFKSKDREHWALVSTDYGATWSSFAFYGGDQLNEIKSFGSYYWQGANGNVGVPNCRVAYTPDSGATLKNANNSYPGAAAGPPVIVDKNAPTVCYTFDLNGSNFDLISIAGSTASPMTKTVLQANIADRIGSTILRGDNMWTDPYTAGHHRLFSTFGLATATLYSTSDTWSTKSGGTALGYADTAALTHIQNTGNTTVVVLGQHTSGAGVKIATLSTEADTTPEARDGANAGSAPYTDSIPRVGTLAMYGIWVGEQPVSSGVYVYSVVEESSAGDWATDISDYDNLGSPMGGDRASFRDMPADGFDVYHAEDVHAATPQIHAPWDEASPPGAGYGIVSDGAKWVVSSDEIALDSDLHDAVTLDADAAVLLDLNGQEIGLDVQNANTVLAGPTTGAANEPTFRKLALSNGDLDDVDITGAGTGDVIYKTSGDWVDYPLGVGTAIVNDGASIKLGDVAGNNYLSVSTSTGEVSLSGDATAFEDLRVEPNVRQAAGAGVPSFEKYFDDTAGTSKGVYLYSFTDESVAGNEKEVFFTMQMPHAWKLGTDISFHVHFVPAATVNTSDIVWGLEYVWKGIGEVFGDTTIIYSSTTLLPDDANITAGKHYLAEFTDIAPGTTASSLSSILIGRLFRNSSAGGDTYTNKVGLLYIDAHYEVDSFGSYSEYGKSTSLTDSDGVTITDSDGVELVDSLG